MLTTLIHKIKQYTQYNKTQQNTPHKMNTYTYTAYHEIKYPHKKIRYPIYFDPKNKQIKYKIKANIHPSVIRKNGRSIYNRYDTFSPNFQNSILNTISTKHKL